MARSRRHKRRRLHQVDASRSAPSWSRASDVTPNWGEQTEIITMLVRVHHERRRVDVDTVAVVVVVAAHDENAVVEVAAFDEFDEAGEVVATDQPMVSSAGSVGSLPVDQLVDLVEFVDPLDHGV